MSNLPTAQLWLVLLVLGAPYLPGAEGLTVFGGCVLFLAGLSLIRGGLSENLSSGMLNGQRDGGNFNNQNRGGVGGVGGAPLNGQTPEGSEYELRSDGVFGLTRHPVYGGLVVGCVGLSMILNSEASLAASFLLYALLSFKAKDEEETLADIHGRDYWAWVENAPRLVPDVGKPQKVLDVIKLSLTEASAGNHDRTAVENDVLNQARSAPLVVFITDNSRPCKRALDLLRENAPTSNLPEPVVVNLDELEKSESTLKRAALGRITGTPTVPFVWIGGRYVGSFDEGPNAEAPGLVKLSFQGRLNLELERRGDMMSPYGPGGMPPNGQGMPPNGQGMPPNGQGMPPNGQGMPPNGQGMPPNPNQQQPGFGQQPGQQPGFGQQGGNQQFGQRPGQGQFGQGQFGQGQFGQGQFGQGQSGQGRFGQGQFGQGQFGQGQFGQGQQQQQRPDYANRITRPFDPNALTARQLAQRDRRDQAASRPQQGGDGAPPVFRGPDGMWRAADGTPVRPP